MIWGLNSTNPISFTLTLTPSLCLWLEMNANLIQASIFIKLFVTN